MDKVKTVSSRALIWVMMPITLLATLSSAPDLVLCFNADGAIACEHSEDGLNCTHQTGIQAFLSLRDNGKRSCLDLPLPAAPLVTSAPVAQQVNALGAGPLTEGLSDGTGLRPFESSPGTRFDSCIVRLLL